MSIEAVPLGELSAAFDYTSLSPEVAERQRARAPRILGLHRDRQHLRSGSAALEGEPRATIKRDMGLIRELFLRLEALEKLPHRRERLHSEGDELRFDVPQPAPHDFTAAFNHVLDLMRAANDQPAN